MIRGCLISVITLFHSLVACFSISAFAQKQITDVVMFGDPSSEEQHDVEGAGSKIITGGGLNEPARILLPPDTAYWEGGKVAFRMKVHPGKQNYFTAKFWGSEANPNYLVLFCEGKQVGYHHLGDYDVLYMGDPVPAYNGRFFYNTTPLPMALTQGKTELTFEVRSRGPYWRYGQTFEQYQRNMEQAGCDIYGVYTHTDGCFMPPAVEKQGALPAQIPVRKEPGEEVLVKLKERVDKSIDGLLRSSKPLEQQEMFFLAKAWHVKWTRAYHNHEVKLRTNFDRQYGANRPANRILQPKKKYAPVSPTHPHSNTRKHINT